MPTLAEKLNGAQPSSLAGRLAGNAPTPAPAATPQPFNIHPNTPIDFTTSKLPGAPIGQAIGTLGGYALMKVKDMINGTNNAQYYNTQSTSPTAAVGDAARIAGLVGGLAFAPTTIAGAAAVGAGSGALQAGGNTAVEGGNATDIAKSTAAGAAVGGATAGGMAVIGKLLGALGDKIMLTEIKPGKADIADGFSLDTIKKHNLGGTLNQIQTKTQEKLNLLTEQLNQRLQGSGATLNLHDVVAETERQLGQQSGKLGNFGMNTKIGGALNQLKGEVMALGDGNVSVPEAQVVKQAAGGFGAWAFGKTDPEAKASEVIYNTFYRNLKTAIEKASPEGVRDINAEISKLIPIQNAILRRIPVASRNAPISLTDMIGLAASTVNPHALGLTLVNILSKSGAVGNFLSKYASLLAKPAGVLGGAAGGAIGSAGQTTPTPQQ